MNRGSYIKRGFKKKCPACGEVPLYIKFLKTHQKCKSCGIKLSNYKSDDGPAYLTILLVGHIIIPLVLLTEKKLSLSIYSQMLIWPLFTLLLSLWLLPKIKGAFIGFQISVDDKT